jgi:branched-chain amino acid transport system permease protein
MGWGVSEKSMSIQIVGFLLIAGLQAGCIYATLALSYYVITRATGILNFAQGEWMMLAAVFGASFLALRLPYFVAVFASVVLSAFIAVAAERLIIRPLEARKAPVDTLIVALLGIMIVARYGTALWFGHEEHVLPGPFGAAPITLPAGVILQAQSLLVFGMTALLFIGFWALDHFTRLGLTLRVAAIDGVGAQLCGISLSQVRLAAFAIGGLIAAVVGWLYAPLYAAGYSIGTVAGMKGFIVLVIGGLGSPWGSLIAGLFIGFLEVIVAFYVSSIYSDAIVFAALLAVLLLRPSGLIAQRN